MPKGKRKGKSDRRGYEGSIQISDDDSVNDNASIFSNCSENKSVEDDNDADELIQDQFEEKLIEVLDGLTQKSSQGRTNCLLSASKALVSKYTPVFVTERHFTICDGIERSLKKGGVAERGAAAELASLICVQLGAEDVIEEVCKALKPVLLTTACEKSVTPSVRGKCCAALGLVCFLSGIEVGDTLSIMQEFENIFSGSYLKGDKSVPNIPQDVANLHASALSAWGLLLTSLEPSSVLMMMNNTKTLPSLQQLTELLTSQHLEVRLTAGEVLALIFELGREENEEFSRDYDSIVENLRGLATDSHKYRAKKDRKQQRATFRDLLLFIEEDTVSDIQIKFGKEVLVLDTWTKRKHYDTLCTVLGPGINIHLAENEFLREIFQIIAPIIQQSDAPTYAQNQMERFRKRMLNAANFKARTISRAKNRDKRSDF